jgi:hypothetical protein
VEVRPEIPVLLVLDVEGKIALQLIIIDSGNQVLARYHRPADPEAAAGEAFGGGLHDDVRAVADGAQQCGGGDG